MYGNRGMGMGMGQPLPQRQGGAGGANRRNNRNFNNRSSRFDQPYGGGFQNNQQNRSMNFNNQSPKPQIKEPVKPIVPQQVPAKQEPVKQEPLKQEPVTPVQQAPKPVVVQQAPKPPTPKPSVPSSPVQSRPASAQSNPPNQNQQNRTPQQNIQQSNVRPVQNAPQNTPRPAQNNPPQNNNARPVQQNVGQQNTPRPAQQNVHQQNQQQNNMRPPGQQNQQQNGPPKNQPSKPINVNANQQQQQQQPQQTQQQQPQHQQNQQNQQNQQHQNQQQQNTNVNKPQQQGNKPQHVQQNKPVQNHQFNQNQNQNQFQHPNSNYSSTTSLNKVGQDGPQRGGGGGGRGGGRRQIPGEKGAPGNREEHFMMTKLNELSGSMVDLPPLDQTEQKFSGRNRLYIGNLTNDVTDDELLEIFSVYGETSELFVNKEKNFAFIRIDYKANAEKAKREVDGRMRRGRPLRVRFAPHNAAIKVKNLTSYVSNELLYKAFEVFGKVERAVVKVDERGKSLGEGIVEFFRKAAALAAIRHCNERCFFLTASLRPVVLEISEEVDEIDGYTEKAIPRRGAPEFIRAREVGPRFAEPGSFEHEYGTRWKQLYELYKQKEDAVKRELILEEEKLEAQMEFAKYEHETEVLREQLRLRELDRERQKRSWEMAERQADELREKERESILRQQEDMASRMRLQEDELMRRQQENTLFMKAQQLNRILDQQEQGLGGGRGGYDNSMDNKRGGYDNIGGMQMDSAYDYDSMGGGGHMGYEEGHRWDSRQEDFPNKRRRY